VLPIVTSSLHSKLFHFKEQAPSVYWNWHDWAASMD